MAAKNNKTTKKSIAKATKTNQLRPSSKREGRVGVVTQKTLKSNAVAKRKSAGNKTQKKNSGSQAATPSKRNHKNKSSNPLRKSLLKLTQKFSNWEARHRSNLAICLLVIGISLTILGGGYFVYRQTILSFATAPHTVAYSTRAAAPTSIRIANNHLPLEPATIQDGIWQTSETTATHLTSSANPGENSNIVIYGHNKPSIFKNLHQLKIDDVVDVTAADGKLHQYQVIEISTVKPTNVEVVYPSDRELLTLYTCTGWLDSKRLVVKAVPVDSLGANL